MGRYLRKQCKEGKTVARQESKVSSFFQKIGPMVGYNAASILFGGGGYIISLYFLSFLTEVEKLSVDQAGMVIAMAHIWDAVTDPVMGIITDRTRSKYGRHRRYLLWGVIPIAISYFCLWNSFGISATGNKTATMLYYMLAYMLYNTALTLVTVPHVAMLPVIAPDYSLRTQYNSVQYIMNSVGMVSSFLLVSLSLGFTNMEMTAASRPKFMFFGAVLCLWFSLPLLVTFKCTKEPSSLDMKLPPFNATMLFEEYKQVFRNKAFRRYFVLSSMYTMAKGFYANSNQYFIKYSAQRFGYFNTLQTIAGAAEASGFPVNYLLTMKEKELTGKSTIITTIVTGGIGRDIAGKYGVQVEETLTGFKYIGEKMSQYEKDGSHEFIFGYEESYGYLAGTHARDKDAVVTALLICEMADYFKKQGKTLIDVLAELSKEYGYCLDKLSSYTLAGKKGLAKIADIMAALRVKDVQEILPDIGEIRDYAKGIDGLPAENVLKFILKDHSWIAVRPSGTEPKIKIYCSLKGKDLSLIHISEPTRP